MEETGMQNSIFRILENNIEKLDYINDHIKETEINKYDIEKPNLNDKMNLMNSMIDQMGMNNQMDSMMMNNSMIDQMNMNNQKKNMVMNQMDQNMMNQMYMNNLMNSMMMNNQMASMMMNLAGLEDKEKINGKTNQGINVIFRHSGEKVEENPHPKMVQCLIDEKVSDIVQRYRAKSCDYDPTKIFIFNAKLLNQDLTVVEAGLTNNCNIFVKSTKGIKGAGGIPLMFTDLSKNKTKEIGLSKKTPSYKKVTKGINIFGICNCKKCKAYKKVVVVKIKKKKLDLIKERDKLFCPECEATIIPKTVGFYLCKFRIYGKKLLDDQVERFENEKDEANKKYSLKYFDPELNGEVTVLELFFEVLEYL